MLHAAASHHQQLLSLPHVVAYAAIASCVASAVVAFVTWRLAVSTKAMAASGDKTAAAAVQAAAAGAQELELLKTQADAAQQQSVAAQEALDASMRPLLIDVPPFTMQPRPLTPMERLAYRNRPAEMPPYIEEDASVIEVAPPSEDYERGLLRVPVRNIGAGPALLQAARLAAAPIDIHGDLRANGVMQSVVAPGQVVIVEFEHQEPRPGWLGQQLGNTHRVLVVELTYTDIAERQLTSTRLIISGNGDNPDEGFAVRRVEPLKPPQLYEPPSNFQTLVRKIAEESDP
jgi:hypothetical protein